MWKEEFAFERENGEKAAVFMRPLPRHNGSGRW